MISSHVILHVKRSPLLWLHNKSRLWQQKNSQVKWFGISVGFYIINRTLLKNFSLDRCAHSWNTFHRSNRNFVSPHGHVMASIFTRRWPFFITFSCVTRKQMSVTLNGTYSIHTPIDSLLKRVRILNSAGVCRQLILTRFHFTFPQKKSSASRKTNSVKPRGRNAKEVIYVVVSFLNLAYSAACKESCVR